MKKRNPVARLLREALFQPKILPVKKGKGTYKRIKLDKRADYTNEFNDSFL